MASEETKAEWRRIKKARGAQSGIITKLHNKLHRLRGEDSSTYDFRTLERAAASIAKALTTFEQTVEDAAAIIKNDDETQAEAEAETLEAFTEKAE